jgi:hypothetical protein
MRGHKGPVEAYVQRDREGSTHFYSNSWLTDKNLLYLGGVELRPTSNFLMKHDVSEASSASVFRQGKHLFLCTPYIELYSVIGHHTSVNLLKHKPENRSCPMVVIRKWHIKSYVIVCVECNPGLMFVVSLWTIRAWKKADKHGRRKHICRHTQRIYCCICYACLLCQGWTQRC